MSVVPWRARPNVGMKALPDSWTRFSAHSCSTKRSSFVH